MPQSPPYPHAPRFGRVPASSRPQVRERCDSPCHPSYSCLRDPDRPADGGARRHDRQRGPPAHPAEPGLLDQRPLVGHERLHPHVRRASSSSEPGPATSSAAVGSSSPASPSSRSAPSSGGWPQSGGCSWPPGRSRASVLPWPRRRRSPCSPPFSPKGPSGSAPSASTPRCRPPAARPAGGRGAAHPTGFVAMGHVRQRPHRAGRLAHRPDRPRRDRTPPRALRPGRRVQLHPWRHRNRARPGRGRDQWVDERR